MGRGRTLFFVSNSIISLSLIRHGLKGGHPAQGTQWLDKLRVGHGPCLNDC